MRHIDQPRHGVAMVERAADAWSTATKIYGVAHSIYQVGRVAAPYVTQAVRTAAPYVAAAMA